MFLHAWQLSLKHPLTDEPLTFNAELPDTLKDVLKQLEKQ
jgi:23S rRNA pseudouridine955/2504/2580 synthase